MAAIDLREQIPVTIPTGGTSDAINLGAKSVVGIYVPAGYEGNTISLQVAPSLAGTYVPVLGSQRSVAAGQYVAFQPADTAGLKFVKFVAPSQAASRIITVIARAV